MRPSLAVATIPTAALTQILPADLDIPVFGQLPSAQAPRSAGDKTPRRTSPVWTARAGAAGRPTAGLRPRHGRPVAGPRTTPHTRASRAYHLSGIGPASVPLEGDRAVPRYAAPERSGHAEGPPCRGAGATTNQKSTRPMGTPTRRSHEKPRRAAVGADGRHDRCTSRPYASKGDAGDRLPELGVDLVRLRVDGVFAGGRACS